MAFQYLFDVWAPNGTKTAPSTTLKSTGFVGGMKPPASVFNYQWDKIGRAITELQESVSTTKSTSVDVALAASAWSSNTYTFSNPNITSTCVVEMIPQTTITSDQLKALQSANIIGGAQSEGSIVLKAMGTVPTINIPVTFIIRGDL